MAAPSKEIMASAPQKDQAHPVRRRLDKKKKSPKIEPAPEVAPPVPETIWGRAQAYVRNWFDEFRKGQVGWFTSFVFHAALLLCLYGVIIGFEPRPKALSIDSVMLEENGEEDFETLLDESTLDLPELDPAESSPMMLEQEMLSQESDLLLPSGDDEALTSNLLGGEESGGKAGFFGTSAVGNSFVFIVDSSGSMTGERFERAKLELRRSIKNLKANQKFHVLFFNSEAISMFEPRKRVGLVSSSDTNRTKVRRWIERQQPSSTTNPEGAIRLALQLKPSAIFLLSDGEFDDPDASRRAAVEENRSSTVIHTIAFMSREGEATLRKIATDHGGTYRFVK